jgi:lysophospholipase L1-like esterase
VATILDLADYYGCGVVDLKERWGSYAESSPTLPYFDTLHPNNRAYADVARALTNALAYS